MKFLHINSILAVMFMASGSEAFVPANKRSVTVVPTTTTSLNLESLEQKTPDYDAKTAINRDYFHKKWGL